MKTGLKLKTLVVAAGLALAAAPGFAGVSSTYDNATHTFYFSATGISSGFSIFDIFALTPQPGLPSGAYSIEGDISGSLLSFSSVTLNGSPFTLFGPKFKTGEISLGATLPLLLEVKGTAGTFNDSLVKANYQGSLVLTPVPEPQTYALLFAGLAAIGFVVRRRDSQG